MLEAISVALGGFLSGIDGVNTIHFSKDEIPLMKQAMEKACNALDYLTDGKIDAAMSKFSH